MLTLSFLLKLSVFFFVLYMYCFDHYVLRGHLLIVQSICCSGYSFTLIFIFFFMSGKFSSNIYLEVFLCICSDLLLLSLLVTFVALVFLYTGHDFLDNFASLLLDFIFFDWGIHFFYLVNNEWDSLFYPLHSIGKAFLWSFSLNF